MTRDLDPLKLDQSLERLAQLSARFRVALRSHDAAEHAFELRPRELEEEPLGELLEANQRDPLREPLGRWSSALLVRQACIDVERRVAHALRRDLHPLDQPLRGHFSVAALLQHALTDAPRRARWLNAVAARGSSLQGARFEQWETRALAEQRYGSPAPSTFPGDAARELLERTRDAYGSLGVDSPERLLELALGRDALGQYPTRLTPRSLVELVGEGGWLNGLSPDFAELPQPLGSSSFLRALAEFGAALHRATGVGRRPFVLHHDPARLREHLFAGLFALLPTLRPFAERQLQVGRACLGDHERGLFRVSLLGMRSAALSALLADFEARGARAYRDAFVEFTQLAFGFEFDARLAGVLFVRPHAEARLVGLLLALNENQEFVERHDEDWFRNPRAVAEQRARLQAPPELTLDAAALSQGSAIFARQLADRL
ncbi:MAG: hypothetical protein QM756_21300 [Polyangiaceae bacterium]